MMLPCKHFGLQVSDKKGPQDSSFSCVPTFYVVMFYDIITRDEFSRAFPLSYLHNGNT